MLSDEDIKNLKALGGNEKKAYLYCAIDPFSCAT
jgi:hypothetical protein